MFVIFDKDTEIERSIPMAFMNEQPMVNKMTCDIAIKVTKSSDIPDLSQFKDHPTFETIDVVSEDGITLPLMGNYSKITSLYANYSDIEKVYSIGMAVE